MTTSRRRGQQPQQEAPPAAEPAQAKKAVLYVELDPTLKRRLVRLAELPHRARKITAEAILAITRYLEQEEAAEGLGPIEEAEGE